ncbi:hypothetical protein J2X69_002385 [Algoriphagus sp. 4150]|uniref:hypothetical protein n=1 Tax=Algoriphagus sp. 4150 TaxID=2817756 RepID=UPI00285B0443|nr:hypothetical protein [Algoriphagus sp. 4150]MDR7130038.1 hypothetical protein [Algoriphagus sp. 4150]
MNNLNQSYPISPKAKAFYQSNNYIKLKQVLSPEEVAHFNEVITAEVQRKNTQYRPFQKSNTIFKEFCLIFSLFLRTTKFKLSLLKVITVLV